jgi:hypothetical protein
MVLREGLVALVVALPFGIGAALGAAEDPPRAAFRFADPAIVESSGLVFTDGLVVTVNDSGDSARVFAVDPADGRTVGVTRWAGEPVDVEALAPAGPGEVWVGDIGDNTATRDTIRVTRVPVGRGERQVEGAAYDLAYPDGAADAEALLAHPDTGRLLVVTKSVLGGRVYAAPERLRADRVNQLRPLGGVMPLVTDGGFLPDGRHLVLRDYSRAVVLTFPRLEDVGGFALPEQQQGEGLAVTARDRLLVSTEGRTAPVHDVRLPAGIAADRPPASPPAPETGPSPGAVPEVPEEQPGPRDPTQWLIGVGLGLVALMVLVRSLRPR